MFFFISLFTDLYFLQQEVAEKANKGVYEAAKKSGEIKNGEWVLVAGGEIRMRATHEHDLMPALGRCLYEEKKWAYFAQVGNEDPIYYVGSLEANNDGKCWRKSFVIKSDEYEVDVDFKLDTGTFYSVLTKATFDALQPKCARLITCGGAFDEKSKPREAYHISVKIVEDRFEPTLAFVGQHNLIGLDVLQHFALHMNNNTCMCLIPK